MLAKKYWKSQKDPRFIEHRRHDLNLLFALANADVDSMEDILIRTFLKNYAKFIRAENRQYPNRQLGQANRLLKENPSLKTKTKAKDISRWVQSYLVLRLDAIIRASVLLWDTPLWTVSGCLNVGVDPINDRFLAELSFDENNPKGLFEVEKDLIDLRLSELIHDLDLRPSRLRRCQRCKKLFYQPTAKDKRYCSDTCASAVRQERYKKKRKTKSG